MHKMFVSAVMTVGLIGNAAAASLSIDDFSTIQTAVQSRTSAIGPALTGAGFWTSRVLSIVSATGSSSVGAYIEITDGQLQIANGPNVSAISEIMWELDLTALNAALNSATFLEVTIEQVSLDVGTVSVSPGGQARTSAHNSLVVSLFQGSSLATITNPFRVTFDSSLKADSTWDNLKVTYTCRAGATGFTEQDAANDQCQVPVPGGAPLLALGLLGLGFFGRKPLSSVA